jgi:hypothetical protein
MTRRCWAAILVVKMLGGCQPVLAQDLVSPKLVPPVSELRAQVATRHLAFDTENDPPSQTATPHRHWSKAGKIMTTVGAGLIGAGTGALIHGQNTQVACTSNGTVETCASIAWRATGAIWMSGGAALVIVGATRRTED